LSLSPSEWIDRDTDGFLLLSDAIFCGISSTPTFPFAASTNFSCTPSKSALVIAAYSRTTSSAPTSNDSTDAAAPGKSCHVRFSVSSPIKSPSSRSFRGSASCEW
jgi:hypothetical protein